MRSARQAGSPGARRPARALAAALAIAVFAAPAAAKAPARAAPAPIPAAAKPDPLASDVRQFYVARGDAPLWNSMEAGDASQQLLRLLNTAALDGLDAKAFDPADLLLKLREAESGNAAAVKAAEEALSLAFVKYARALQRDPKVGVIYVDKELKPGPLPAAALLEQAAKAPSLSLFVRDLGWMNPIYAELRRALAERDSTDARTRHQLSLNLERARALPAGSGRYLLVNTADQRLTMYENGKPAGQMKVVAGRPNAQTPLMNAYVRYAVMNPYWNVPSDLTRKLAPNVVQRGKAYLNEKGYEVVSSFEEGASVIDPATIDWRAVAAGKVAVQLRQKPGPANSMGKVKFMFPNSQGVWLHDTPSREHFAKDVRLVSSGCVRLEDAWRLGSWLFGKRLRPTTREPEKRVELPAPVPVYITYLTAVPDGQTVRFIADLYKRDPPPIEAP